MTLSFCDPVALGRQSVFVMTVYVRHLPLLRLRQLLDLPIVSLVVLVVSL